MASSSSFFYSHRIWFFFQAMLFPESDPTIGKQRLKSRLMFRCLKDSCIKSKERLYLANSKDIIQLIQEVGILDKYPDIKEYLASQRASESSMVKRLMGKFQPNPERPLTQEDIQRAQRVR